MRAQTKTALLIFTTLSLIYFFSARGGIEVSDTLFSVRTAEAIVNQHSLSLEECTPGYCYRSHKDGRFYSRYGLGLAFIFAPYVILGKAIASLSGLPQDRLINFLISFYNIFFGAGACVVMFYLARFFRNSRRVSLGLALLLGLGTFCWRYSAWDFSEVAQMFFLITAVYCALRNNLKLLALGGLSFSCLLLLKILYLAYLPVFVLYILVNNRRDLKTGLTRAGLFLFSALLGFWLTLIFNYARFGELLEFGYGAEAVNFYLSGIKEHAPRLLYWLDKGIFIYNPVFILGILGYYKLFRMFRREAVFFFSLILLNLMLTSSWYGWHGGWSWGPRYMVPFAPLWLLPCFVFFHRRGAARALVIALIGASCLIQGLSILQGNLEYLSLCNANEQEGLRKGMPAQIIGSAIMLKHKIAKNDTTYRLSEFGIDSATIVDTAHFGYYGGFDLWYMKASGYFNQPLLRYLPALLLPVIAACLIFLFRLRGAP